MEWITLVIQSLTNPFMWIGITLAIIGIAVSFASLTPQTKKIGILLTTIGVLLAIVSVVIQQLFQTISGNVILIGTTLVLVAAFWPIKK